MIVMKARHECEARLRALFPDKIAADLPATAEIGSEDVGEWIRAGSAFVVRQHAAVVRARAFFDFGHLSRVLHDDEIVVEHKHRWNQARQRTSVQRYLGEIDSTVFYWRQVNLAALRPDLPQLPVPQNLRADSVFIDHMWVGPDDTIQTFHQDNHDDTIVNHNLFMQCQGTKYVAIAPPCDSQVFRSRPLVPHSCRHSSASPFDAAVQLACSSLSHTVLGPGDMLYMPGQYWHYLRSLSPSISVSRWWFGNRIAETIYMVASGGVVRMTNGTLGSDEWHRDLSDLGGQEVLVAMLARLSDHLRYVVMLSLIRAYGECAADTTCSVRYGAR